MSNESQQQISELRSLAQHNVDQINRAAGGLITIMRNAAESFGAPANPMSAYALHLVKQSFDMTEANLAAFCDHAHKLAQANSPAECVKLQAEFVRSSMVSMQKQSIQMMGADGGNIGEHEKTK